jgi:hypothetical protein
LEEEIQSTKKALLLLMLLPLQTGLSLKEMMEGSLGSLSCPVEKNCLKWMEVYLKDCVCSRRDEVSLTLGLLSVFSWGVAEVPQILTNYKMKSTEGISLLFLMTWVVG